ncbi:hypothetical protein OMP38_03250 [Cohnella ginsengisoli]|uniref:OLD protein-like TOPRIM domain-containing protein n=1 Tax=Cohnella ginsengisoli TaxID=425004 RepID=A0A9X4QKZ7_9BACL|nr:TOPRIM nucleotidyl transferase/hydrolase domain-containing protein [Cohnella ginsengisoli]MDG0789980.1 hypothetical protein [Cohnella ginsengisoli]
MFPALGLAYTFLSDVYDFDRVGVSVINAGGKNNIKALIQLLGNFNIPSVAVIDYDSKDKKHEKELEQIKAVTDNLYELPRHVDMGDIEGFVCLNAPIGELASFLEEILPAERVDDLISEMQGIARTIDGDRADQIKFIREAEAGLAACILLVESLPDAEFRVRKALAGGFRKVKGRTTGRLIGERFWMHFPSEFIEKTLDHVIKLAGYEIIFADEGTEDEMS